MQLLTSRPIGRGIARPAFHRAVQPARKLVVVMRSNGKKGSAEPVEKADQSGFLALGLSIFGLALGCLMLGGMAISDLKTEIAKVSGAVDKVGTDIGAKVDKALEKDAKIEGANDAFRDLITTQLKKRL